MKKIYISISIITFLIFSYFLFEPIVTYTSGWSALPDTKSLQPLLSHEEKILKKADSVLKIIHNRSQSPAVSIAVGLNDKIVWSNAVGYKNIQDKIPVNLETKFRIGSTSKAVTSIGIGVLLANKQLNLESTIKDFVPYASEHLSKLTLKQLASHTSGIRNYGVCFCFPIWEYYNNNSYATVQESVDIFNNDDLLFSAGSSFSYSSYNYTLLSAMIEGASKMSFPNFMQQHVFVPLDAKNIVAETSDLPKETAKFYEISDHKYKEVYAVNNSNKWAGGGFLATPTDLVKIGNSLMNHQLFNTKITDILIAPVLLNNGEINEQHYAMGWRNHTSDIFNNGRNIKVWHHGGIANGSLSLLALFPEYNLSISMLANKNGSSADLFDNVYQIASLFINNTNLKE